MNRLHERCLLLLYNDQKSSFHDLLEKYSLCPRSISTPNFENLSIFSNFLSLQSFRNLRGNMHIDCYITNPVPFWLQQLKATLNHFRVLKFLDQDCISQYFKSSKIFLWLLQYYDKILLQRWLELMSIKAEKWRRSKTSYIFRGQRLYCYHN